MKKLILSILTILLVVSVFAQKVDRRRPTSIGVSFFLNDFQTAAEIKRNGFSSYLRTGKFFATDRLNPGLALNYLKGLSNHIDFNGTLGASFVDYPISNVAPFSKNNLLLEATGNLNIKLLSDNYWITPYADLGVGISKYKNYYAAFVPVGVGVQLNLHEEVFVRLNTQARLAVTENATGHLYHSLTLYSVLGKKK